MDYLTKRISARCSESEYQEFLKKCEIAKMTRAEFTRKMIFSSTVKELDKVYQKKILFLLYNISNNVNQIAYYANIEKSLDEKILKNLSSILEFTNSIKA
ncbi:MAG: plasmid mobilization relaxosome protein MobC [Sulfurimonas sp.]|jgi:hypothetical protein